MGQQLGESNSIKNDHSIKRVETDHSFILMHANKDLKTISQYLPNNVCVCMQISFYIALPKSQILYLPSAMMIFSGFMSK